MRQQEQFSAFPQRKKVWCLCKQRLSRVCVCVWRTANFPGPHTHRHTHPQSTVAICTC